MLSLIIEAIKRSGILLLEHTIGIMHCIDDVHVAQPFGLHFYHSGMLRLATLYLHGIRNFGKFKHYNMRLICLGTSCSYSRYTQSLFPQIYSIDSCHNNLSRLLHCAPKYGV